MRLALECPTYLLKEIQPLGDFDWILAHLVLQDEEYAKFYRDSARYKVLDNSVNELLNPCRLTDMKKAVKVLGGVDTVVPPDFLGDAEETRKALKEALSDFGEDEVLPAIQGEDESSVFACAEYYETLGIKQVAVPYDITCSRTDPIEIMSECRLKVVKKLRRDYGFELHLLGMTTLEELEKQAKLGYAESMDTGSPVLHGLNRMRFGRVVLLDKSIPTMELMPKDNNQTDWKCIYYNIAYLRKVIS